MLFLSDETFFGKNGIIIIRIRVNRALERVDCGKRSHYPESASALDFNDAATPRFGQSSVVYYMFIETRIFSFDHPLIQFFGTLGQNNLTLCQRYQKYHLLSVSAVD